MSTIYNDTTLEQIDRLAQDVQMQPVVDAYIIVDTNILQLSLLQQFVRDVERAALSVLLIIPGVVLNELDGQKKSERLGWFSRRASEWLLEKIRQTPTRSLRVQANHETCRTSGNWKIRQRGEVYGERSNDDLILDCCKYFATLGSRTCLCSADRNLCIEGESETQVRIRAISPRSSNDLAELLFGRQIHTFAGPQEDYTGIESLEQEDSMDVDEDAKLTPPQAMDLLHLQVIDHFTRLLVALVGRVGGTALEDIGSSDGGVTASQHAPKWKNSNKPYQHWNAADCLQYLKIDQKIPATQPRLDLFLSKPYSAPGARCGREWSFEAWSNALDGLKRVGEYWNDPMIIGDLGELAEHKRAVFRR